MLGYLSSQDTVTWVNQYRTIIWKGRRQFKWCDVVDEIAELLEFEIPSHDRRRHCKWCDMVDEIAELFEFETTSHDMLMG